MRNVLNQKVSIINFNTLFLVLLFLVYLIIGLPSLYKRIAWCDGYALGDWLINYEDGGFKRRGLSGSFFILLSKTTGIYIGKLVFTSISMLYLSFACMLVYHFRKIKFEFYTLLFFLLPTVILFPINDEYAFGRKEIIFFNILLFFIITYKIKNIYSWKYIFFLSFVIFIGTLFHELILFYVPYILVVYLKDFVCQKKGSILKMLTIALSTIIPSLFIFIIGGEINEGNSWTIFKQLGISENIMTGIFSWPKEGFGSNQVNALDFARDNNYFLYSLSYIITMITFFVFIKRYNYFGIKPKVVFLIHIAMILYSFPIFFLTIDWGRWLNIHFIASLFVVSLFLPKWNHSTEISSVDLLKQILNKEMIFKLIILLTIIFYFSMEHVNVGFKIGQNGLLENLRDLFWKIRHLKF
jgi:hypothetical protein